MSWYVFSWFVFPLLIVLLSPFIVILGYAIAGHSVFDLLERLCNRGPKLTCWHCGRETASDRSTCQHCKNELQ